MLRTMAALVAASLAVSAGTVAAQEMGDSKRGHLLAETVCSECHAIDRGAPRSRNGNAPTFESIANTRGMTPMALRVALRTPHREMPNLVLKNGDIDDIIAYLDTLK